MMRELLMDVLRALSAPNLDIRKKTLDIALDLIDARNIDEVRVAGWWGKQWCRGCMGGGRAGWRACTLQFAIKRAHRTAGGGLRGESDRDLLSQRSMLHYCIWQHRS